MNLWNWLVPLVFLFSTVSNTSGQLKADSIEDFETNDFSKFPWEHRGDASWGTNWQERHSGNFSAKSASIEDNQSATLRITLGCISDNLAFYCKVSSESDYDYLAFSIDGVEKGKWSGEQDWVEVSFPVDAGTRTFEWTYSKDSSVSDGDDTAWIDDIAFPVDSDTAPPQPLTPDVNGVDLYLDDIAPDITETSWITNGILDFYSEDNPAAGDYCIHWTGADLQNTISFSSSPDKDLSILVDEGFVLDFWIRCDSPGAQLLTRFMDTKTDDPNDHPWRVVYTIDPNDAVWDGRWNHLQIPLSEFSEQGSWDNGQWYNPVDAFDWAAIEHFDIVTEYGNLEGIHFYFDTIRLLKPVPRQVQGVESSLVHEGMDGRLAYETYANEGQTNSVNTIPDFSHCGYMGGGVAIPNVPVAVTLHPEDGDDAGAIQEAINYVSSLSADANGFRGAVLLAAGRYQVSRTLTITADGVVLRGQGQDVLGTVLEATGASDYDVINVRGSGEYSTISSTVRLITSPYVPTGTCTFEVENTDEYSVGDWIIVQRTPNQFWIDDLAMSQYGWTPDSYRHMYERYVVGITGNTITIDSPIVDVMEDQYGGGRIYKSRALSRVEQCGVENLRIESTYASDTDESHPWDAVVLRDVKDCWVRKVTAQYFAYSCVKVESESIRATIEDCAFVDPKSVLTGSRRYAFNLNARANHILFQRCYADDARHSFVTGSRVPGPNAFVDCYAYNSNTDSGPHHRWAVGTLFDNVYDSKEINVQNRGPSGTGHGWAGAQQVLWNCTAGSIICEAPKGAMNLAIGCSGTRSNGRWINEADGCWESQRRPVSPRSLYYRQLEDRLGPNAVENVTTPEQRSGNIWSDLVEWGRTID